MTEPKAIAKAVAEYTSYAAVSESSPYREGRRAVTSPRFWIENT